MPFTRAQATALLNKSEMRLFDDSRANALRGLDRDALDGRITRTRAARDRARDLLRRQRAAARKRGEGKDEGIAARTARKEALLVELLERFVEARRAAPRAPAKKAAAKKAPARKVPAKKAATSKTTAKKIAARKAAPGKVAAKKATAGKAEAKAAGTKGAAVNAGKGASPPDEAPAKAVAKKTPGRATRKAARRLTPERALENTRRLLEEKQERDRTPQSWQTLDPGSGQAAQPGYQSPQAASKAAELHAGESRMASIHGSQSTRDRHNQGKRDHRGDTE